MKAVTKTENVALNSSSPVLIGEVFEIYFSFVTVAFAAPRSEPENRNRDRMSILGEAAMEKIGDFFLSSCQLEEIPLPQILHRCVQVLKTPLKAKYQCFRDSNWRVAMSVLIKILENGIPLARAKSPSLDAEEKSRFDGFWSELSNTLEHFLFPESIHDQKQEERMADEAVDCHIIELLRDQVLPFPDVVPGDFIRRIVVLLNRGSIHSSIKLNEDCSGSVGLREDFAKQCFETLLDFSLLRNNNSNNSNNSLANSAMGDTLSIASTSSNASSLEDPNQATSLTNKLAITSLLQRFKEVLVDAIDGEKLNRNIPLQRQKTAEIAFVLRAIATVIASLKKSQTGGRTVDKKTWQQVIALYPYLVQCTETTSPQISASVKDALLEYHDLLQPNLNP